MSGSEIDNKNDSEFYLEIEDGKLFVKTIGEGRPLIFLHGGPGADHQFELSFANSLKDKYQCILFDQRGTGKSIISKLNNDTLSPNKFLSDLERIIRHFKLKEINLVGKSWGARLACYFAIMMTDKIHSVLSINSPYFFKDPSIEYLEKLSKAEYEEFCQIQKLRAKGNRNHVKRLHELRSIYSVKKPEFRQAYVTYMLSLPDPNEIAGIATSLAFEGQFSLEDYKKITAKTLILHGDWDYSGAEDCLRLKDVSDKFDIKIFKDCGHSPRFECREEFDVVVNDFLNNL